MPVGVVQTTRDFFEKIKAHAPSDPDYILTQVREIIADCFEVPRETVESKWVVAELASNGVDLNVDVEFSFDPHDPRRININQIKAMELRLFGELQVCAERRKWGTVSVSPKPSYMGRFTMLEFDDRGNLIRAVGDNREVVKRANERIAARSQE